MENEQDSLLAFSLSEKMEFANRETGDTDETFQLWFRGPTYREIDQAAAMEQHVYQAFGTMRKGITEAQMAAARAEAGNRDDGDRKMSGPEIMVMLSTHGDLRQVLKDFEKLVLKVGSFNEKTAMVEKHFRSMSVQDIRRLCGEYLAFFILPSVFAELESIS